MNEDWIKEFEERYAAEEAIARAEFERQYKKQEADKGFSAKKMATNIIPSTGNLLRDTLAPLFHPKDTATAMKNLAVGGYEKFTPGIQPEEAVVDAVGQYYKDRYSDIPKTIQNDPAGILSDIAGIATLGGAVVSKLPKVGKVGEKVMKAGMAIDPLNIPINMAKVPVKGALHTKWFKDSPVNAVQSSSKFSTTLSQPERRSLAETMIKHQIPPNEKGVLKAENLTRNLSNDIDNIINSYTDKGVMLNTDKVLSGADAVSAKLSGINSTDGLGNFNKSQAVKEKWLNSPDYRSNVTPTEMQGIKKGFYNEINFDRGRGKGKSMPVEETKKGMAKGAKESLETLDPRIKPMNKELGDLLNLSDPLNRASSRIANRDMMGIGVPIKVFAGDALNDSYGGALGLAMGMIDNPMLKAKAGLWGGKLQNSNLLDLFTDNSLSAEVLRQSLLNMGRSTEASKEEVKEIKRKKRKQQ